MQKYSWRPDLVGPLVCSFVLLLAGVSEAQYRVECRAGTAKAYDKNGAPTGGPPNSVCTGNDLGVDLGQLDMTQIAVRITKKEVPFKGPGWRKTPDGWSWNPGPNLPAHPGCKEGAGCKAVDVPVPVPLSRVRLVQFRANQNSELDRGCVAGKLRQDSGKWMIDLLGTDGKPYPVQNGIGCAIDWSGWEEIHATDAGHIVGTFKNWSAHEDIRSGQIRVWFSR